MPYTQDNLEFQVSTPLGKDKVLFYRMEGREALGQPFEYRLEVLSEDAEIKLEDLIGKPISVKVTLPEEATRYFHGIAVEFGHAGAVGKLELYEIILKPEFWLLSHTGDCRIFQEKTVPDIIKEILRDRGLTDFEDALSESYRTWDYCVQYRESDFHFLSRLMEQEGIYYYFKHEESKHTLVLSDASNSHGTMAGYATVPYYPPIDQDVRERDHLSGWIFTRKFQTDKVVLTDYDFERPKADLLSQSKAADSQTGGKYEVFDYPGEYVVKSDGDTYSKVRLQERRAAVAEFKGQGNARGLSTGYLFTLEKFPRDDQNIEYLITSASYVLTSHDLQSRSRGQTEKPFACEITAIPGQTPFRPPKKTRKPTVQGPQTAVVVGKQGEEIWTDKYGRVKVQFHWDRYGESDENSSCWVRVAQVWAGKNWGAMHIPRIGQEVIVDFLEGDPDQPIITGRVYNADNMPPYVLPDNQSQSGLKSRSTKEGTGENFNELRFEDKKGEEEIYFHGEKNFNRIVENDDTLKVGFEKKDKGDQTIEIHNNQTLTVGNSGSEDGSQTMTIWKNRTATIKEGDETLTVEKGNRTYNVKQGNESLEVGQGNRTVTVTTGNDTHTVKQGNRVVEVSMGDDTLTIKMGNQTTKLNVGKSTTDAMQAIELKVGANSIKIEQSGITISGVMVKIQGQSQVTIEGPITQIKGSGMVQIQGGVVMIN